MSGSSKPASRPDFTLLKALCAAAEVDVADDDLPALAVALANHQAAVAQLRRLPLELAEPAVPFDSRWT